MVWISFDPFRTLGFANTLQIKPDQVFKYKAEINAADWVLFPPYWQLNALAYGLSARIFPSEASYRLGHNKIEMTRAFELVAPRNTPQTRILANTPENATAIWDDMPLPFVAKLPKASQGNGVWLIDSFPDWKNYVAHSDVLYVQEYLPIDRDIRLVVVGEKIIAGYWRKVSQRGFYNNIAKGGSVERSPVPQEAIDLALFLSRQLGINHAGYDIAMVGGHPYVIEFNRLFGNQGIDGGDLYLRETILQYLGGHFIPTGPNFPNRPSAPRKYLKRAA